MFKDYSTEENKYPDLWNSFIEGNKEAFSALYNLSYQPLFSYGISFNISREQARDVIHDIFVKIYSEPFIIKNPDAIKTFLFTSMRNACINAQKYERKLSTFDEGTFEFNINYSIKENIIVEREEQEELKKTIDSILAKLTSTQREIIYLRFLYQMNYDRICEIMNISNQAARNLTYRAIKRIRKQSAILSPYLIFSLIEISK